MFAVVVVGRINRKHYLFAYDTLYNVNRVAFYIKGAISPLTQLPHSRLEQYYNFEWDTLSEYATLKGYNHSDKWFMK